MRAGVRFYKDTTRRALYLVDLDCQQCFEFNKKGVEGVAIPTANIEEICFYQFQTWVVYLHEAQYQADIYLLDNVLLYLSGQRYKADMNCFEKI